MHIKIGSFEYNGQKKKKVKRKTEFSKIILIVSWLSGSVIIAFACWLTYMMVIHGLHGDVQLVSIILSGGFAEISLGTGFYYWKARKENELKLTGQITKEDELI